MINNELKEELEHLKKVANDAGYFDAECTEENKKILKELERLGYVEQLGDWTGFKSTYSPFKLTSKAYYNN